MPEEDRIKAIDAEIAAARLAETKLRDEARGLEVQEAELERREEQIEEKRERLEDARERLEDERELLQDAHHRQDVTVEVYSAKDPDNPKTFTWPLAEKVGAAAQQAAVAFGYATGNFTLGHGGTIFKRDETLEAAHVHQHEHLRLLDIGGGV